MGPRIAAGEATKKKTLLGLIALVVISAGAVAWAVMADDLDAQRARLPAQIASSAATPTAAPATPSLAAPASLARPAPPAPPPLKPVRRAPRSRLSPVMQAALADPNAEKHFLVDVATMRDSAPGQLILNCLPRHLRAELSELKDKADFDPLSQVEQVGMVDRLAVVEGQFAGVDWAQLNPEFAHEQRDGVDVYSEGDRLFAVIEGRQLIAGERATVEAALARVQSGETGGAPMPVGDANGTLPLRALASMLPMRPEVRQPLRDMFREGNPLAQVRVDVGDAGAQVQFDLSGLDPMLLEGVKAGVEAAKGGGLQPDHTDTFAELVQGIEVEDGEDGLRIRAPVSMATLSGILGDCGQDDEL